MEKILREKIKDERFMRYIIRLFKAGVLADGDLNVSQEGLAQGSPSSPTLSNIFAHYVLDLWIAEVGKKYCTGTVELFRYGDDAVICCQYEKDAMRIKKALSQRLDKYKLKLNGRRQKSSLSPGGRINKEFSISLGLHIIGGAPVKGSSFQK